MIFERIASFSATMVLFYLLVSSPANAQRMPREDVIDVPATGEGLRTSNVFQSNMVLQRDQPIRVWGWASPGETVSVNFLDHGVAAVAGSDRRWEVELPAVASSVKPTSMIVCGEEESIELENILVGDVWILGGQSNMEFEIAKVENGNLEIISANFPEIRVLTVPYGQGPDAKQNFARLHEWSDWFGRHFRKGDWEECNPKTVRELSAIGYVFARRIHKAAQVPIGVIDASRGGTTIETWTPMEVLRQMDGAATKAKLETVDTAVAEWDANEDLKRRIEQHKAWTDRQIEQGKQIPEDRKRPPSDLRPGPIGDHNYPGHCYAGMIAPLEGLAVKGVIFHQGYNNAFDGSLGVEMYREVLPEMIRAWRRAFLNDGLPFGIISLCTDGYPQTEEDYCEKMFNAGIEIRAAQYETFSELFQNGDRNVGFASSYDLRRRWYHPQLKIPAGERIARWALATQYGFDREVEWMPPRLVQMERLEGALSLTIDREVGDPEDGKILGFAIAGEDRKFHPASVDYAEKGKDTRGRTQYDRKRLMLTSPMVPDPVHFRYAWGRNPMANLQATGNRDLPFATQRSDDWNMEEVPSGVLTTPVSRPISRGDRGKILAALREQDRQRRISEAKQVLSEIN